MKLKRKSLIKWSLVVFASLVIALVAFGFWFMSLIPKQTEDPTTSLPEDLPYLSENLLPHRGKILTVVTSTDVMGSSQKRTGYELTELSRAYYVFQANGFEVDVASPKGGKPPVIIDDEDMGAYDYAFLNDPIAQHKTSNTLAIHDVDPNAYRAIYFVGGKGAMWDFPENTTIQSIVSEYYQSGKVIGAVCHGPAALVNVTLEDGSSLLNDKTISSFTNSEELFLIPEAASIFPFLLEDKLVEQGAQFNEGTMYLEKVSHDGNLVTGQNPWSTWTVAETMIRQLGYAPKRRVKTAEENTISILTMYEDEGYREAKQLMKEMYAAEENVGRTLLAMHSIVAVMQWNIGKTVNLIRLLSAAKSIAEKPVN